MGTTMFAGCTQLATVNLPEGLKKIAFSSFYKCSTLSSLALPSTLEIIESAAFQEPALSGTLILPDLLQFIESNAFNGCSNLTNISLPATVNSVGANAFTGCSNLPFEIRGTGGSFSVFAGGKVLVQDNGAEGKTLHTVTSVSGAITIPGGVTAIPGSFFKDKTALTSVSIPPSVTSIGSYAFQASGLTEVIMEGSTPSHTTKCISNVPLQELRISYIHLRTRRAGREPRCGNKRLQGRERPLCKPGCKRLFRRGNPPGQTPSRTAQPWRRWNCPRG
jgi:hypothetical protein